MQVTEKPKWWAVIYDRKGGYALDVYDDEVELYRKSLRRQKAKVVEGFMTPHEAMAEVHRQLLIMTSGGARCQDVPNASAL